MKNIDNKGITIIALVITIIVLLILAGVTIVTLIGTNGILTKASDASKKTEIANEQEQVELAYETAKINKLGDEVERQDLQTELDNLVGKNATSVTDNLEGILDVKFNQTGNHYIIENGKVEKAHIFLNKNAISLQIKDGETSTEQLIVNLVDITGDIVWTSLDQTIATVDENGIVTAIKEGETTIKVSCGEYSTTCTVTVSKALQIGDYINYNVSYKDCRNFDYTSLNGWRVLNSTENEDGTYNVKIVSTGVPVGYRYNANQIKTFSYPDGTTYTGTLEQRQKYIDTFNTSGTVEDPNIYAVSGWYYNFRKLVLKNNSNSVNYGYYKMINGINDQELTGEIFIDTNLENHITEVRTMVLSDIPNATSTSTNIEDTDGLFALENLYKSAEAEEHGVNEYVYSSAIYWLANPSANGSYIKYMYNGRVLDSTGSSECFMRVIINIDNVNLTKKDGVWEIYS